MGGDHDHVGMTHLLREFNKVAEHPALLLCSYLQLGRAAKAARDDSIDFSAS